MSSLKQGMPSISKSRRRNLQRPVTSKSARLEEKLDGLVSLLKAGAHSDALAADTHAIAGIHDSAHHSKVRAISSTSPYSQIEGRTVTSILDDHIPSLPALSPHNTDSEGTLNSSSASTLYDAGEPSPIEAEQYLALFNAHKSKYFPFLHFPASVSYLV